jgi:hypothetical protein
MRACGGIPVPALPTANSISRAFSFLGCRLFRTRNATAHSAASMCYRLPRAGISRSESLPLQLSRSDASPAHQSSRVSKDHPNVMCFRQLC